MIDPQLENRVALVTGANNPRGIGASIARALAAQGVKVFITYKRLHDDALTETPATEPGLAMYAQGRAQDASEVIEAIRSAGGSAEAIEADMSHPEMIPTLFDAAEAVFGPVEILVNNAAHWEPDTFLPSAADLVNQFSVSWMDNAVPTFDADAHDRIFAVNARGTAHMMAEFARRHVDRGAGWGRIINISTDGAWNFPSEISYGASKLALESYSRSAASELGQFGVTVNVVSPGPIQTGYITGEMETSIAQNTPLGRVGYPDDIADAVVLLASEQARWITGQLIHVGGGHRM